MYKKGTGNDKQRKDAGNRMLCPYRNFSQAIRRESKRASESSWAGTGPPSHVGLEQYYHTVFWEESSVFSIVLEQKLMLGWG